MWSQTCPDTGSRRCINNHAPVSFHHPGGVLYSKKTLESKTSMVRCHPSELISFIGPTLPKIPALLKTISSFPKFFTAKSTAPATPSRKQHQRRKLNRYHLTLRLGLSSFYLKIYDNTTRPSATNFLTVPSPIPLAPPVTRATLSFNLAILTPCPLFFS